MEPDAAENCFATRPSLFLRGTTICGLGLANRLTLLIGP